MRRELLVCWCVVALTWLVGTGAAADAASDGRPKAVAPEPVKDFGIVARGERIAHGFVVRNEGDGVLNITEVKPTCGCTVAKFDRTVPPGGTGLIEAEVETTNLRGPIAKSVQVFTNDPDNPKLNLVIKANVKSRIEAHPGYARFIAVQGEGTQSSAQTVWSSEYRDLTVQRVESPYPFLKVSYREAIGAEKRSEGKGRQWRIQLSLPADAPVGPLSDYVTVYTNHPEQKTLKIPVAGFVRPLLTVTPRIADFGRRELAEPQSANLEIKNLGSEAVELGEVSTDLEGLEAEIETLEEGHLYKVVLTLKPGFPKGAFAGTVTIETSSSRQPQIEVTVRGVVL